MATDYTTPTPAVRYAQEFDTWAEYRKHVREINGGRLPHGFQIMEDALVCRFAQVFGVDREVFDALLWDPEIFTNLGIHAASVKHHLKPITAVDEFYGDYNDVEAMGGQEAYDNWRRAQHAEYMAAVAEREARRKPKGQIRYWLYRIYGEDDRLLYIGVTRNPDGREKAHRKKWGSVIDRFEYEEFFDHETLLAEERKLIALHNPPFNAEHVGADA